jgi:centrosomal protein CEP76
MSIVGGSNFANKEFQEGIKHYVPEGHTFKAFPIQFTHCDSDRMLAHMFANKTGSEIFLCKGD